LTRRPQSNAAKMIATLAGVVAVNASLSIGWGGLSYFSSFYRTMLALLLSGEIAAARLIESDTVGDLIIKRQSLLLLLGPFWLTWNGVLAHALKRHGNLHGRFQVLVTFMGLAFLAVGMAGRIWAVKSLGQWFSWHVTSFPGHQLVTSGPYALCRHPAYLASMIHIAGLGMAFHAPVAGCIGLAVQMAAIAWRIRDEERLLIHILPQAYSEYQQSVPGLIPTMLSNSRPQT
jgi:protein-S-isoprenylcysteine O-methyltransferase Ste14